MRSSDHLSLAEGYIMETLYPILHVICLVAGAASILGSIAIWAYVREPDDVEKKAYAQRFGIFVGLWAPTFFILANYFRAMVEATS
jgi:hypothetical protein